MRWREILRCGVSGAFPPVSVNVHPLDDSRAAAIPAGRVEPFKDFRESRGECISEAAGGKVPPGR